MDLIPIKKSHITFYNRFELYHISKEGEPLLYKKAEKKLDQEMLDRNQYPEFYIKKEDEARVIKDLQKVLNIRLFKAISSKGLSVIREAIYMIIEEALAGPVDISLGRLPETIEIILTGAKAKTGLLESLVSINKKSSKVVDHSINVFSLTAQYCFFKSFPVEQAKNLCLCALLHDIGITQIDHGLFESRNRLTDEQFVTYQTHPVKGYKKIKKYKDFDASVAQTVLEHHERLDGQGYPNKLKDICFEAQVIGLVDSYEALKYHEKNFRNHLRAYEALQIIKKDVVDGKYNREVFVDLCSCLIK